MEEGWYCYTITSDADDKLIYSGATNNISRRMRQHNGLSANKSKYTRRFGWKTANPC